MKNVVGRFLVRKDGILGLFVPISSSLVPGIYEIREVMGEYIIVRIGEPAMRPERLNALSLDGLYYERAHTMMTNHELQLCAEALLNG